MGTVKKQIPVHLELSQNVIGMDSERFNHNMEEFGLPELPKEIINYNKINNARVPAMSDDIYNTLSKLMVYGKRDEEAYYALHVAYLNMIFRFNNGWFHEISDLDNDYLAFYFKTTSTAVENARCYLAKQNEINQTPKTLIK